MHGQGRRNLFGKIRHPRVANDNGVRAVSGVEGGIPGRRTDHRARLGLRSSGAALTTGFPHFILIKDNDIEMYVDNDLKVMDALCPTDDNLDED